MAPLSSGLQLGFLLPKRRTTARHEPPYNPRFATPVGYHTKQVWALPRSLATTKGISLISSPRGTEMFHFPRLPSYGYGFTAGYRLSPTGGFPHSDIPGSTPACGSPRHIGACPVLHRLLAPRHPPCALFRLTKSLPGVGFAAIGSKTISFSNRRSPSDCGVGCFTPWSTHFQCVSLVVQQSSLHSSALPDSSALLVRQSDSGSFYSTQSNSATGAATL